ncbi:unnamed protein product, partial [Ectocarpus sp. 12 AP-2014]
QKLIAGGVGEGSEAVGARGSNQSEDGEEQRLSSPWALYKRSMSERPLLTKSVTSALVSALGELMGSALRSSPPPPLPVGAGTALAVKGRVGAGQGTGTAAPGLLRRTAAFAIFGLLVNGPVFHWWYGALERAAARRRKAGELPGGAGDITFKVAVDRFLMTPPYLAITLASLRLLQGLGAKRSIGETSALYRGVLF